MFVTRF